MSDAESNLFGLRMGMGSDYRLNVDINWQWLYLLPYLAFVSKNYYYDAIGTPMVWVASIALLGPAIWGVRRTVKQISSVEEGLVLRDVEIEKLQKQVHRLQKKVKKLKKELKTSTDPSAGDETNLDD